MKATLNKKERLKSKKAIELLFSEGKSISQYPIRLVYNKTKIEENTSVKAAVTVSKRNFKNAVDRNHIKRLLRESYRKNKYIVTKGSDQFTFMFLYSGKEIPEYALVEAKMKKILQKFVATEIELK